MVKLPGIRIYKRQDCITFRKTAEKFGGLSNMAGGYPLLINDINILTSEALYQACRFPHLPEVQKLIIAERSPMTAKMKSKPYRDNSRPDWDVVRTKIMRWCLQVKLLQNWEKFSNVLLETKDLPIVEDSKRDDFWGAKSQDEETLIGANVLGRLLMQLREQVKKGEITHTTTVLPLKIPNFILFDQDIGSVSANQKYYLVSHNQENKVVSQPGSYTVIPRSSISDSNSEEKDNLADISQEESIAIENDLRKYDAFLIMLPYIKKLLETEHTDKELAEIFQVPLILMRTWLKRAVSLGDVKKLSKPVRYIVESQLPLFKNNFSMTKTLT